MPSRPAPNHRSDTASEAHENADDDEHAHGAPLPSQDLLVAVFVNASEDRVNGMPSPPRSGTIGGTIA